MNAADLARLGHDQLIAHVRRSVDVTGHYVSDRRVPAARIEVYPKRRQMVPARAGVVAPVGVPTVCATVTPIAAGPSYADFFAPATSHLATA